MYKPGDVVKIPVLRSDNGTRRWRVHRTIDAKVVFANDRYVTVDLGKFKTSFPLTARMEIKEYAFADLYYFEC